MATSLVGPLVCRAFSAAPVPRPPQPTRASWMVVVAGGVDGGDGDAGQGGGGGDLGGRLQKIPTGDIVGGCHSWRVLGAW